jgi:hypothetical protein
MTIDIGLGQIKENKGNAFEELHTLVMDQEKKEFNVTESMMIQSIGSRDWHRYVVVTSIAASHSLLRGIGSQMYILRGTSGRLN